MPHIDSYIRVVLHSQLSNRMSPLPLLLPVLVLVLLQLSWYTAANTEFIEAQNAPIASSGRSPAELNFQLSTLQDQLRSWKDLPLDLSFSFFANLCSNIMELGIVQPKIIPDMSRMSFVLQQDACRNVSVPLTQANELWTTKGFLPERPTVIYISGWTTTINSSNSGPVAKAFACRNDTNFMILDAANFLRTLYTWSALNTEAIGRYVAEALFKLDLNYVTKNVHLIGHSLGAQIAGSAGRYFEELSGSKLSRVTGLDPANPCFYDGEELPGLRSGDAEYVDIIYSNPGVAGTSKAAADGNFFVEGLVPIKSGCTGLDAIPCSHERAVEYLTETVYPNNTRNFKGKYCTLYANLWTGNTCSRFRTAIMGYAAKDTGLYYVDANKDEPYGKEANLNTFTPSSSSCGACNPDN